ncbi:hypothetical protein ALP05_02440 [Pseudomonas caricapapayae]|uniref:DUF3987 domain-containing protein n=1 Tax=Pseudomonas caricapapayae TaxID=46678 RepID=A0A3M6F824_9PSED|nr:YfjI family protein [Pseudomonas caricapapayae]RMV76781.1 hypothetical protein ALP05_02440 [Pseudomonas caricapapayae]
MYSNSGYSILPISGSLYPALSQAHPIFNSTISEAAENYGIPLEFISLTALSAISAALQGLLDVKMPTGGDLPVSLNVLIMVPSGGGKNRTINLFKKPFEEFEEDQLKGYLVEVKNHEARLEIWSYERKRLLRKTRGVQDEQMALERFLQHSSQEPIAPLRYRTIFEDTTPEALLASMAKGGRNAWLVTSEGGIVLSQHAMRNMPALNQIWSGDRVTVDRKVGDSFTLVDSRLSVLIMSQPGIFESFVSDYGALARESGFFARCLVLDVPAHMLNRLVDDRELEWNNLKNFNSKVSRFLRMELSRVDRASIEFSPEARRRWIEIQNAVVWERRYGGRFDKFPDLAARTPENIARVAALLHFFEDRMGGISLETLDYASRLCFWHVDQFSKMFSERSSGEADVKFLYDWFWVRYKNLGIKDHRKNDVRQRAPSALRKNGRFDAAFEILQSRGYLTVQIFQKKTWGVTFYPQGNSSL